MQYRILNLAKYGGKKLGLKKVTSNLKMKYILWPFEVNSCCIAALWRPLPVSYKLCLTKTINDWKLMTSLTACSLGVLMFSCALLVAS